MKHYWSGYQWIVKSNPMKYLRFQSTLHVRTMVVASSTSRYDPNENYIATEWAL